MLQIIRTVLRAGLFTRRYPAVPEPAPPAYRGRPALDAGRCTGSGACVAICPSGALSLGPPAPGGSRPWQLDLARCVFCGLCAEACPAGAIRITTDYELAARSRPDLVITVLPDGGAAGEQIVSGQR